MIHFFFPIACVTDFNDTAGVVLLLFMFGMLFSGLGILGEYVWRNLEETRKRPVFIIDAHHRSIYSKHNEGAGPK